MSRQQAVMEPFDHSHRQNNQAVFMGLEVSEKMVGNVPDNGHFLRYIGADRIEFFIGSHLIRPFVERKYL